MRFEDVYKYYYHDVYCFLLAMSKSPETAEEITQETFYRALKSIHKFKGECSLKSWLCQIAKNTYLNDLKKQKIFEKKEINQEFLKHLQKDSTEEELDAEAIYLRKEEKLSIYKILHSLDEPYKEVFTLRTVGDLSFKEIGEIFERKEGWARVTYHRAKLKIQELIKEV